jgi:hypothetical protein
MVRSLPTLSSMALVALAFWQPPNAHAAGLLIGIR